MSKNGAHASALLVETATSAACPAPLNYPEGPSMSPLELRGLERKGQGFGLNQTGVPSSKPRNFPRLGFLICEMRAMGHALPSLRHCEDEINEGEIPRTLSSAGRYHERADSCLFPIISHGGGMSGILGIPTGCHTPYDLFHTPGTSVRVGHPGSTGEVTCPSWEIAELGLELRST